MIALSKDSVHLQLSYFEFDYEEFFKNESFYELKFLIHYIRARGSLMEESELYCVLKLIVKRRWVNIFLSDHKEELIILISRLEKLKFLEFD